MYPGKFKGRDTSPGEAVLLPTGSRGRRAERLDGWEDSVRTVCAAPRKSTHGVWGATEARQFRNPETNGPSEAASALMRAGGVGLATVYGQLIQSPTGPTILTNGPVVDRNGTASLPAAPGNRVPGAG
jgi:hypothetical protein